MGTLMPKMGIGALYRKPNTSKKHPQHLVYPYLLRGMKIDRANQVWAMDITYVPMARGWVYRKRGFKAPLRRTPAVSTIR